MRYCAYLACLVALSIAGCSSARIVESSPTGGCIAISDNTDTWPSYHRTRAMDLMKKQCPAGFHIVREQEVVTGQVTTNNTQKDTKETPILKGLVTGVQETTRNSTEVHDKTEYRIWYQKVQ